jgi:hypothetical protein
LNCAGDHTAKHIISVTTSGGGFDVSAGGGTKDDVAVTVDGSFTIDSSSSSSLLSSSSEDYSYESGTGIQIQPKGNPDSGNKARPAGEVVERQLTAIAIGGSVGGGGGAGFVVAGRNSYARVGTVNYGRASVVAAGGVYPGVAYVNRQPVYVAGMHHFEPLG